MYPEERQQAIASLVMFILTFTPQPIVGPTLLDGLLQYFR